MRISILGAGHAGTAVAADLSLRGHDVTLIKTSRSINDNHFEHLIMSGGAVRLTERGETRLAFIGHVTRDLSYIAKSELVILYTQSNYHEPLIRRMRPHLKSGQILLINPGYLSTAYVLKHCPGIDLTIVEAQSSFLDCRITSPGAVRISFRNVQNPLGVYPAHKKAACERALSALGYPFTYVSNVAEAALHNPNLIVHTVGAIMSIPRVERTKGEYYMYREVFTPSVWRILEALDGEKMDVMEKMGLKRVPYVEACKFRNDPSNARDAKTVFFDYANMPNPLKGPLRVDSRFISEDVPQGLVLLEGLGGALGVKTPMCTSLIDIATAALGRDLRAEGRTLERLGRDTVRRILRDGGDVDARGA
ncbi:MAG: NAD/NADP octopine/nopaline dehydrogenase family protein [Christensenellales bacterium]|jgi:opine dehydrogenase